MSTALPLLAIPFLWWGLRKLGYRSQAWIVPIGLGFHWLVWRGHGRDPELLVAFAIYLAAVVGSLAAWSGGRHARARRDWIPRPSAGPMESTMDTARTMPRNGSVEPPDSWKRMVSRPQDTRATAPVIPILSGRRHAQSAGVDARQPDHGGEPGGTAFLPQGLNVESARDSAPDAFFGGAELLERITGHMSPAQRATLLVELAQPNVRFELLFAPAIHPGDGLRSESTPARGVARARGSASQQPMNRAGDPPATVVEEENFDTPSATPVAGWSADFMVEFSGIAGAHCSHLAILCEIVDDAGIWREEADGNLFVTPPVSLFVIRTRNQTVQRMDAANRDIARWMAQGTEVAIGALIGERDGLGRGAQIVGMTRR